MLKKKPKKKKKKRCNCNSAMQSILLFTLLLTFTYLTNTVSQTNNVLGILLNNRQFALELHRRCNPDDPISSHPITKTATTTVPTWRKEWQVNSMDFPCGNNTAPGLKCEVFHDNTPGKEGKWLQITSIELPSWGLDCFQEVVVSQYNLEHLHTLDLSGSANQIDIDTFRAFLLPAMPNIVHLNVGYALTHQITSSPDNSRFVRSGSTFSLCTLSHLKFIDLTNGAIEGPLLGNDCIGNLPQLKTLLLSGNNFSSCSPDIMALPLEKIDISKNPHLTFTLERNSSVGNCLAVPSLKHIDFSYSVRHGSLESWICTAHAALETLILRNSYHVTNLPDCFITMKKLKVLDISSTSIVPNAWLQGMTSLETLQWGNMQAPKLFLQNWNTATLFPNNHLGLPNLQVLNLSSIPFTNTKSNSVSTTITLNTILLYKSNMNATMNATIVSMFSGLQILDVSSCKLSGPFNIVVPLHKLKEFHGGNNRLIHDLSSIIKFGKNNLQILDVSNNVLTGELTNGLFHSLSTSIRILRVSNNKLTSKNAPLQYLLSNFEALEVLELAYNNIKGTLDGTVLPASINLKMVDLRGGIVHSVTTKTLQTTYSKILYLDRGNFQVDIATVDNDASVLTSCFAIRFYKTNAFLKIDPIDSLYAHCICLGGGGTPPNCLNCPKNALCGLLGNGLRCYSGYWYDPISNTCIPCGVNQTTTSMLTTTTAIHSSGMYCPNDGTTSKLIQINPGYWRVTGRPREDPMSYQKCLVPGACGGGNNSNCTEGYDGILCSQCFSGGSDSNEDRIYDPASDMGFTRYYLSTDGRCKTCTTNAITKNGLYVIWISTLVFILGLGVMFGFYVYVTDTYHYNQLGAWKGRQKYSNILFGYFTNPSTLLLAGHLSTVGTLATTCGATVNFPHQTRVILGYLSAIFDGNLIGLDGVACRFARVNDWPMEPYMRIVLLCLVPVVIAFILLLVYISSVVAMWRLWVLHHEYYEENINGCCKIREREFPPNIVVLIRRRLINFYFFILCFFYPSFFTNGIRASVLSCLTIAGSPEFVVDPLAGHPAINEWFKYLCAGPTAKGSIVDTYWMSYYMAVGILSVHCVIVPLSGLLWLFCHRRHIVNFHVDEHLGDGDVVQMPSVDVKKPPGSVLGLKFMFEHFEQGSTCLRVFGYFSELLHRVGVAVFTIVYDHQNEGLLYASLFVLLHMLFIIIRRPYNRTDVYAASCLADGASMVVLLSVALYRESLMVADTLDMVMTITTWLIVGSSFFFHVFRQCTVVKKGLHKLKYNTGGPKNRNTGSSWGRRYHYGDEAEDKKDRTKEDQTEVVPFEDFHENDHNKNQGMLYDASSARPTLMISPPNIKSVGMDTSTSRLEKDIRFKLKAWWYRYSFVQRWHDTFRKEHHKIPSRVDQAKDPDLIRNQQRLDQRTRELYAMNVTDPASAFRERNLKPKQDNRLVMVPKDTTNDGFEVIKREKNILSEKSNFGLKVERSANSLSAYDNVLTGETPGNQKFVKARTKKNRKVKEEWEDPLVVGNGNHRLTKLPRRSMYQVMTLEEKLDGPPPLPIRPQMPN